MLTLGLAAGNENPLLPASYDVAWTLIVVPLLLVVFALVAVVIGTRRRRRRAATRTDRPTAH